MVSALAVVTAVRHRDRTGEGQRVHTSLFHTALGMISNMVYRYEELDGAHFDAFVPKLAELRKSGAGFAEQQSAYADHHDMWPVGNIYFRHYQTQDGFISVGCLSPRLNERFREATGLVDPRNAGLVKRGSKEEEAAVELLRDEAEALFASRQSEHWLETLRAHGVPATHFNFPHEIFDDPQANANGYIETLEHPQLGNYQVVTPPLKMEASPVQARGPSPTLGAHTSEVLEEAGFDAASRQALIDEGIAGPYKA